MIQPFDILFYKGDSLISRIIKIFSKPYTHCAIVLDEFHTLEDSWKNFCTIKHFNYKYKDYDIYRLNIEIDDYQKQAILKYIIQHIETGYDWIYLFTRMFYFLLGTKILNSKKYLTCDELVVEAFKSVGIQLVDDQKILTPSVLSKSKYLIKIN